MKLLETCKAPPLSEVVTQTGFPSTTIRGSGEETSDYFVSAVTKARCLHCSHSWTPKTARPSKCPSCKNPRWDMEPKFRVHATFWEWVDSSGGDDACWPYEGYKDRDGYGRYKARAAHREAYALTFGPLPEDKPSVLHNCDNPPCCNPKHLYAGTQQDNMRDRQVRGRTPTGPRNGRHTHGAYAGTRVPGTRLRLSAHPEMAASR